MRYDWIDEFLLKKRSVTKDFQPVWKWVRYHMGGGGRCLLLCVLTIMTSLSISI